METPTTLSVVNSTPSFAKLTFSPFPTLLCYAISTVPPLNKKLNSKWDGLIISFFYISAFDPQQMYKCRGTFVGHQVCISTLALFFLVLTESKMINARIKGLIISICHRPGLAMSYQCNEKRAKTCH